MPISNSNGNLSSVTPGVLSGNTSLIGGVFPNPQYACPRCRAGYCELPVECSVCGLTLVAAPHLARAYHHLFPLPPFIEEPATAQLTGADKTTDQSSKAIDEHRVGMSEVEDTSPAQLKCTGCNCLLSLGKPVSIKRI
ncbi:unnamed protein product [Protopolystoma xenopodis]|uniref:C2H2-type domain-containing protein n=1 Tax=Protopolystoma xenopodis TaxID=117903 RepID=A0A3S5CAZ6_9PLAT|nr:unnamed protein product [Protopolystoma xenopodis]